MTRSLPDWKTYDIGELRLGDDSASVVIVEFADFECPVCRKAHHAMKDIESRYPGRVRTLFRHFPLSIHPRARLLASAAQCAGTNSTFAPMRDSLFALAPGLGRPEIPGLVSRASRVDTSAVAQCIEDFKTIAAIHRDSVAAVALGVQGTPTFVVNSTLVSGFPGDAEFAKLVEKEIRKSNGGS
jgi:protein-disulfide isomerase